MPRKSTGSQVDARRADVEDHLSRGLFEKKHRRALAERWGVAERQIIRDRDAVVTEWTEARRGISREDERVRILAQSQAVFRMALDMASPTKRGRTTVPGDARALSVAQACLDFQADVLGVRAPVQVDLSVSADVRSVAVDVVAALGDVAALLGVPVDSLPALYDQTKDAP
jgi:hypothetical protein